MTEAVTLQLEAQAYAASVDGKFTCLSGSTLLTAGMQVTIAELDALSSPTGNTYTRTVRSVTRYVPPAAEVIGLLAQGIVFARWINIEDARFYGVQVSNSLEISVPNAGFEHTVTSPFLVTTAEQQAKKGTLVEIAAQNGKDSRIKLVMTDPIILPTPTNDIQALIEHGIALVEWEQPQE